jgi:hypothetical protein
LFLRQIKKKEFFKLKKQLKCLIARERSFEMFLFSSSKWKLLLRALRSEFGKIECAKNIVFSHLKEKKW